MVKPINGQNWRQFLKFENINICNILNGGHDIEYIQSIKQQYFLLFPGLPKKFPIETRKYFAKSIKLFQSDEEIKKSGVRAPDQFLTPKMLPNGVYRHTLRFYTDSDPEGFMVFWHIEFYDSMGEDRL